MTYSATTKRSTEGHEPGRPPGAALGRNVFVLGVTSLLTDISSEMIASVLPLYLMFHLQVSPLTLGLIDGVQQGGASLARVASGVFSDRARSYRLIAALGYALSAIAKLALPFAGTSSWGLFGATFTDRIGKGIRTSPRDAMISLSAPPERLGAAFGVHRAFDTAGAMLGPVVAFGLLYWLPEAYDVVFVTSFGIALLGVAVVTSFASDAGATTAPRASTLRGLLEPILRSRGYRWLALTAIALGLFTLSDNFVYLSLQRRLAFPTSWIPLFYVATPLIYLLLAVPAGRLADRLGAGKVIATGYAALFGVYALLLCAPFVDAHLGQHPWLLLSVCIALLGVYYACTDGILMALTSALLEPAQRATGMAIVTTCLGVGKLCAGVAFGATWGTLPLGFALGAMALGLLLTLGALSLTLRRTQPDPSHA